MDKKTYTWEELKEMESGTLLYEEKRHNNILFKILRGPSSLCAYVGIPITHPLAGFDYDAIPTDAPHGGLTFGRRGAGALESTHWWYGWDYAHHGDDVLYSMRDLVFHGGKKWLVEDVLEDSWETRYFFDTFATFAETMFLKCMDWRRKLEECNA